MGANPTLIEGVIVHRVEINQGVRKSFQDLTCSVPGCTHIMSTAVAHTMKPAPIIMKMAKTRGWSISGNNWKNRICPNHSMTEPKETVMIEKTILPVDKIPSEAAREQRRKVFFEIDGAYEGKAYKNGFSDQIIADKLKVSLNMVQMIREENFGPAGHSTKVIEIQNAIKDLSAKLDKIEEETMNALTRADTAAQALRRDLAALEDKFHKLESLL